MHFLMVDYIRPSEKILLGEKSHVQNFEICHWPTSWNSLCQPVEAGGTTPFDGNFITAVEGLVRVSY